MFALHLEMNRLRFKNFNSLASTVILYNLTNTLNYVRVTFRNELGVFSVVYDALSRLSHLGGLLSLSKKKKNCAVW